MSNFGVTVNYLNCGDIFASMDKEAASVLEDLKNRVGGKGQFLNWVNLPELQLKRVDEIYAMADKLRAATGKDLLTVVGIGGSKHTVENLVNLAGYGKNVRFYSDIDPISLSRMKMDLPEGKFLNSNYLIVSKSGTTFETEDGFLNVLKGLAAEYNSLGQDGEKMAEKHIVAVTGADEKTSKLRRISNEKGYLGDLFIHDDVGGRFSALDDQGLFTLAYAGMKKEDMVKMLEAAVKMTELSLSSDISKNPALQKGIFYADSVKKEIFDFIHMLFGKPFEGGTENWIKQMHGESLKDNRLAVMKGPDCMHHSAEGTFDKRNKFNITATAYDAKGVKGFENYATYTQEIVTPNFAKVAPTSLELLTINEKGITPEATGAYCQLKHFETIYKGMMRRAINGEAQPAVLDEVLQPSVEDYKRGAFKDGLLNPGK